MQWLGLLTADQQARLRTIVANGLAQRTPPAVLLDDLKATGLTHETAVLAFVHFRWLGYPWWVRSASLFGRVQSRPMALYGITMMSVSVVLLLAMSWLGWSKNPDGSWWLAALGAGLCGGRALWHGQAVRWIDRHGSWLFAGLSGGQIHTLVEEVEHELQQNNINSDKEGDRSDELS